MATIHYYQMAFRFLFEIVIQRISPNCQLLLLNSDQFLKDLLLEQEEVTDLVVEGGNLAQY